MPPPRLGRQCLAACRVLQGEVPCTDCLVLQEIAMLQIIYRGDLPPRTPTGLVPSPASDIFVAPPIA